jgi:FixJ family two-component response regulator
MAPLEKTSPDPFALVHIVDADEEARRALETWLTLAGLEVRAHASVDSFLATRPDEEPACLVIDAEPFAECCQDCTSAPWQRGTRCPAVVTALQAGVATAVKALKTGAIDFVEKPLRESEIVPAVLAAVEAHRRLLLASRHQSALEAHFKTLTPRERQVMAWVTAGKLNKQVGAELGLSEITVKAHRGSLMRKMGARSLAELVRMSDALGEEIDRIRNERSTPIRSAAAVGHRSDYTHTN